MSILSIMALMFNLLFLSRFSFLWQNKSFVFSNIVTHKFFRNKNIYGLFFATRLSNLPYLTKLFAQKSLLVA